MTTVSGGFKPSGDLCVNILCNRAEERLFSHPAAAAAPVLAETGGTGPETGGDDPASKPAAGAATTAGCPAAQTCFSV